MTLPLCFFRNVHQSFFGNLTISIICQKTKTLIYLIYDNSDINVKCLVPVNDPLPQSPSSCGPPYCLPLTCLSFPPWVPLLLWSFLPHTRHCQPAILFISLFFISTWKQIHFFFLFYLSGWLIYEIEMQWSSKHGGHIAFSQMFPPWGNKYVKWHTNIFFLKEHSGFTSISYKHRFWLTAS